MAFYLRNCWPLALLWVTRTRAPTPPPVGSLSGRVQKCGFRVLAGILIGATQTYLAVLRKGSPQLSGVNGSARLPPRRKGNSPRPEKTWRPLTLGPPAISAKRSTCSLPSLIELLRRESRLTLMAPSESPNELFMQPDGRFLRAPIVASDEATWWPPGVCGVRGRGAGIATKALIFMKIKQVKGNRALLAKNLRRV